MKRILTNLIVTMLLFVIVMIYGLHEKKSHRDLNAEISPIENFYVALLPDGLLTNQLRIMDETLDNSHYILEVVCMEEMNYKFSCATQQVEVKKVFKGDGIQIGDKIDLLKIDSIFFDFMSGPAINMGFVNEMKTGESYLVFLDKKIETYDDMHLYLKNDDYFLAPVFSYTDSKQSFHNSDDTETNSVLYSTVKDDEFFLMSQQAVDEIKTFKEALFLKYPK